MIENFTYHIDFGAGEVQVYPLTDDLVFQDNKAQTLGFFRRILETKLIFKGQDYNNFLAIETGGLCEKLDFDIRYNTGTFYSGEILFRTQNMVWDYDKCRVEIKIEPKDDYTCLTDEWNIERDIFDVANRYTVKTFQGTIEESICIDPNVAIEPLATAPYDCFTGGADSLGWTLISHSAITNIGGDYRRVTLYKREAIVVNYVGGVLPQPPGDGWILVENNPPTNGKYARKLLTLDNLGYTYFNPTGTPEEVWFYKEWQLPGIGQTAEIIEISNGLSLNEILELIMPCRTLRSNLFDINTSGDNPDTDPYTNPRTREIIVWQKTDVKRYSALQDASRETFTPLKLLEMLALMFNMELRVINGEFRFEHITYFDTPQGLDLTILPYSTYIEATNNYKYNSETIPKKEEWRYYENVSKEYKGYPVHYNCGALTDPQENLYIFDRVNNDIGYIIYNNNDIDNDGIVMAETANINGQRVLVSRYIYPLTTAYINGGFSITSLIDHYQRWDRPLITGTLNGTPEVFNTAIKRKIQENIRVKLSAQQWKNFSASELIKTGLGWGEVQSAQWSAKSCTIQLTLLHD